MQITQVWSGAVAEGRNILLNFATSLLYDRYLLIERSNSDEEM